MKELQELLKSKKGKEMSEDGMSAKMTALKDLRSMANDMIGKDLQGLKKVTVASDSPEGLQAGLEKAEDIVGGEENEEMSEMSEDEEMPESPEGDTTSEILEALAQMDEDKKQKILEILKSY